MRDYILKTLMQQVGELATFRAGYDSVDNTAKETANILPSRRLLIIDRYILVAVHDHLDMSAGGTWDRYRRSLNL